MITFNIKYFASSVYVLTYFMALYYSTDYIVYDLNSFYISALFLLAPSLLFSSKVIFFFNKEKIRMYLCNFLIHFTLLYGMYTTLYGSITSYFRPCGDIEVITVDTSDLSMGLGGLISHPYKGGYLHFRKLNMDIYNGLIYLDGKNCGDTFIVESYYKNNIQKLF